MTSRELDAAVVNAIRKGATGQGDIVVWLCREMEMPSTEAYARLPAALVRLRLAGKIACAGRGKGVAWRVLERVA